MAMHAGKVDQLAQDNLRRMHTLDDAWNAQEWDAVAEFHTDDVAVFWPGGNPPTKGGHNHIEEAKAYAKTFPDNRVENNPYKVEFAQGEWTCTVARHTGTFKGPMKTPQGVIQPTGKKFDVEFCTVAHWKDGKIVEEKLFYDLVGVMKQLGIK
ncbi:MAG TPA: ester cyclase [Candidatus Thermoplasmatota archaeon]|nr:ester cyclase [Candidatus Thermoplasmatota archaeon]